LPNLLSGKKAVADMIAELTSAYTGVKAAYEVARAIAKADNAMDVAIVKGHVIDLMDKLLDARKSIDDAQEQIEKRDAEIARLSAALEDKAAVVFEGSAYYRKMPRARRRVIHIARVVSRRTMRSYTLPYRTTPSNPRSARNAKPCSTTTSRIAGDG
jgi:hypothetical protein